MFLKSIHIQNVRCLAEAEISFEKEQGKIRKWTFIAGGNGNGKSTVLKSIALLMAGSEGLLDLLHSPSEWIRIGSEFCTIAGVLSTARGEERAISLTLRQGQNMRQVLGENAASLKQLDDALEHTNRSYLTIGYGGSRHSYHSGFGGIGSAVFHHPRARALATLFAEHATMIPFEQWAIDLHSRKGGASNAIIGEALAGLLPDVGFKVFDPGRRELLFETPDGLVPLRNLSSGYRSVVGFCGDLLYRITEIFGDYNRPLEARGLLLVDELGLHLAPVWQRTLVDFLTRKLPNLQLVVTTNSPLTAHQAGEGELFYLQRQAASEPPTLHQFGGAPNRLLLHQLIMSPVFGVATADSRDVECERQEYRALKSKPRRTEKDQRRLKALQDNLSDVAKWGRITEADREMAALLERIDQKLDRA